MGHVLTSDTNVGPPKYAHGGAIAAVMDDAAGRVAYEGVEKPIRTAKLEVNYRNPIPLLKTVVVESWVERVEGRKYYIKLEIYSNLLNNATNKNKVIYAEGEALMVSLNNKANL